MNLWSQKSFKLKSRKKGCYLVTDEIIYPIAEELKNYSIGMCNVFLKHTSAGLALC